MMLQKIILILFLKFGCFLSSAKFRTEFVKMRDGKNIAIDIYGYDINEKLPVILEMSPYGRTTDNTFRYEADFWYKSGYIFAVADTRGSGDSEGEFQFYASDGQDGYDLIDWIGKQSWSNGKVGMRGSSYSGTNQWFIAANKPKNLLCINPSATRGKPFDNPPFSKSFALDYVLSWVGKHANLVNNSIDWINSDPLSWLKHRPLYTLDEYATGRILPLYREFLHHQTLDSYWEKIILKPENFSQIDIPSLMFTGWFDIMMHGSIMHFKNIVKYSPSKNIHFMVIGPYSHINAADGGIDYFTGQPTKTLGDLVLDDNAFLPALNLTREFYEWCLKDGPKPKWQPLKAYITGKNQWQQSSFFHTDDLENKYLYLKSKNGANSLRGDGELDLEQPFNGHDSYEYNPDKPVLSYLSKNVQDPVDMNFYLNRTDFLVYTSRTIKNPFNIFGEVKLELTFSTNVKDTDFVAFLMDVDEKGHSIKLGSMSSFQMRTRYRYGFDKQILMEPNKIYNLTIEMHEMGHTFLPGHKVRLAITSSFYPVISANLNTGEDIAFDMGPAIKSNQTIYYGSQLNGITSRLHLKSNDLKENCF